jgi:uncharacterized protein (DUF427 family)
MSQSPGHKKWPEHKVLEMPMKHRVRVEIDGQVLAESTDVFRVDEDQHPPRYYFAREGVRMHVLEPSSTVTHCPFKGEAHYFDVVLDGKRYKDAVWTYEEPYDEHQALKGRLAFYEFQVPEIEIHVES